MDPFTKGDLNNLVMNFLVTEGYAEIAEKFQDESGTAMIVDLAKLTDRMMILKAVRSGDIKDAIQKLNALDPQILSGNQHLLFRLKQLQFVDLIKFNEHLAALEFSQEELAQIVVSNPSFQEDLEKTITLFCFDDDELNPFRYLLDEQLRLETSQEVNTAILRSQNCDTESILQKLLKILN